MQYRRLGNTGIDVSVVAFGAGPVPALMTGDSSLERRAATIERAIELGINWFDTAATYGEGRSESNLGEALHELDPANRIHVATKVRLPPGELHDIRGFVLRSCESSLNRLKLPSVTLLQLHNSIAQRRGDQPTSLASADVMGNGGVLDALRELKRGGHVRHLGLTGLGDPETLAEIIRQGEFETVQTPYNVLNPSAGEQMPPGFAETNYGNQFAVCAKQRLGVFAIRVFAGGALAGQPPSQHTKKTPFFPLDLYHRDEQRAAEIERRLSPGRSLRELALRFVLRHATVSAAIIGFSSPAQVDEAVRFADQGPLPDDELQCIGATL